MKSRSCTCSGHLSEPQRLLAENTKLQVQSAERLPRESKALRFVATFHNEETKRVCQKSTPSLSLNSRDLLKEAIKRAKTKRFQQTLIPVLGAPRLLA